jgi:hypothetical protein
VVVAVAVGCCALAAQSLPAALAAPKQSSATSSPAAPVEAPVAPHVRRAERAAKAEGCCAAVSPAPSSLPAEQPREQAAASHRRHTQPGGRPLAPATGEAPAGAAAGPGPGSRRIDRGAGPPRGRHRQEPARRREATGAPGEEAARSERTSAQGVEALARGQRSGSGGRKEGSHGKKPRKEKGKKTTPEPPAGEGAETSGSKKALAKGAEQSTGAASEPASAVAASLSLSAPSTSSGTLPASITTVQPAGKSLVAAGSRARGGARNARRRAASIGGASAATVVAAPATLLLPTGAGGVNPSRPAKSAKRARAKAAQPALVKTITRIVGVVPTPVRILIAVLVALALALAVRSRLAAVRTRRLVRQRGQLLEDVGVLQAALLPVPPARLGPVGTSVAYRPADGPGAGGDFYDVFALENGQLGVIVGDVSGHGREALPHTALVRFTVRAYLEAGMSPRKALQTAGGVLERQLGGSFATVVAATYHPRERTLTYASAGHPPPIVLGDRARPDTAGAIAPITACSAPPIGAGMRTGTRETVVSVPGPARLCFHTDGVTEARIGEDLYGAERLTAALGSLEREASAAGLLDSVAEQTDARPDDMAACLLRVEDGAGAPAILLEELELDRESAAGGRAERFLQACGVEPVEAAEIMRSARARLEQRDTALLELRFGEGGPLVSLRDDNVIHTAALAAASAS